MANELKQSQLVLNEVKYVKEMLETKQIPSFWNTYQMVNRLTRYYLEQDYDRFEVVALVVEFLTQAGIDYEIEAVVEQVNKIKDVNDKDYYPLRELNDTIIFYESELETIKTIKNRTTQQFYFTMLVICKVQEIKGSKNPNHVYSDINDIARLAKLNISNTNKFLIELGFEMKLLKAPLDANYIEVMTSSEGKKHRIKEFNPMNIQEYFIKFFGKHDNEKPIIALDYWNEEKPQYFNSISDASRELGLRHSDISRALNPFGKRGALFVEDYMFINAIRKEGESDKEYNIRMSASKMVMYSLKKCYRGLRSGKTKLSEEFFEEPKIDNKITELDEFVEDMKTFGKRK